MTDKPYISIEDQISLLKKRNLLISDEESAKKRLTRYGYYAIINGFKDPFMVDPNNDAKGFKTGITFDHIFDLFQFDREIRHTVANSLEVFEENLSEVVAHTIAKNISDDQDKYTQRKRYNAGKSYIYRNRTCYPIDTTIRILNKIIVSDKQPMKHYREKHGNVPPWISVKNLTFGELIWLFTLLKKADKTETISKMTGLDATIVEGHINQSKLKPMFHELLLLYLAYRNNASHNGRMYNFCPKKYQLTYNNYLHPTIGVSPADYRLKKGRNRIGVLIRTLRIFENFTPRIILEVGVHFSLKRYLKLHPEDKSYLLSEMEISSQWYENELK